ncbi:MAG: T9SS type A sorting domain-containing protein, partial [Bacteroidota bacterium]|nr:T9SS type A sorting domain-containing protein [Bacteroidota bacterium]
MCFLFLGLLLWLLARPTYAQTLAWQSAIAAAGDVQVQASTTDGVGNVYLAGGFAGTATFGSVTLTTTNPQEAFVARWNATSGFVWAIKGTGSATTGRNLATAIAYSSSILFVAGNFTSSTLTLGSSTTTLTNAQAGTSDIFVARLSTSGGVSGGYPKRAGGTGNDYATAICTYLNTYFYVGGVSGGNATFDNYTLAPAGGFIARYYGYVSPSPLPISPAPVVSAGAAVNALYYASSSVYAAGTFNSAAATVGGSVLTSAGGDDVFVTKLNYLNLLTMNWTRQAGGSGNDVARSLLVSGSNVFVGGSYQSPGITFGTTSLTNPGVANLFVSKLLDAGTSATYAWALQNGGTSTDASNSANALAQYGSSVYVAGAFSGTATFGSQSLTSAGGSDVLLAKIADTGSSASFVAAQQAGGAGADYASGLGSLNARTVYATGQVTAPASFGSTSLGAGAGVRPGFVATLADQAPFLSLVAPNAGAVGTTVTLYGQGLSGTTAVTFAGASTNVVTTGFTVNAAGTQISGVVVPAGAQSGLVNATNALGTSNGVVNFTVLTTPNPAPAWQRVMAFDNSSLIRWAMPAAGGLVVVAGEFSGSITLGSNTLTSAGSRDLFVAKFDPATGSYLWAVRAGGAGDEDIYGGLAVNGNNIYLAGQFYGASITLGTTTLSGMGYSGYIAKLTDAGGSASFTWAQLIDDNSTVFVEALTVSGNNVYVGGDFTGTALTIGSTTALNSNASYDDGYVVKLTDNGGTASFIWAKGIGEVDYSTINVYGLSVNGPVVYVSGGFSGTLNFNGSIPSITSVGSTPGSPGSQDMAVIRLLDSGSGAGITAAVPAGGAGYEFVTGMSRQGNVLYVSGTNSSPTWTGATVTGAGGGFVAKVTDTNGTLSVGWVQLVSGRVYQTAPNGTGLYAASSLVGTGNFNGTPLQSAGGSDGLVLRLADGGSSVSVSWAQAAGGLGADFFQALALAGGRVVVGGSVTPAAAFGSLVVTAPAGLAVGAIGILADPALLAAMPSQLREPLSLFPNPAHGQATVRALMGAETLRLFDLLGREVRHYPVPAGTTEAVLDIRGLPAGLYVLRSALG